MTKEEYLKEYEKLAILKWQEKELGEQLLELTVAQRKAHNETRLQRELVENF